MNLMIQILVSREILKKFSTWIKIINQQIMIFLLIVGQGKVLAFWCFSLLMKYYHNHQYHKYHHHNHTNHLFSIITIFRKTKVSSPISRNTIATLMLLSLRCHCFMPTNNHHHHILLLQQSEGCRGIWCAGCRPAQPGHSMFPFE